MNPLDKAPAIIGKLMNISGMLQRHGNRLLLPSGLNQQQFSIFFEIGKAGKVKQKDMVNRLLLEKAHVSKVVKKLHKMDLITSTASDQDKRSAWLSLTPKGKGVLKECRQIFRVWHRSWTRELGDEQLDEILDTLARLQTLIEKNTIR